MMKRMSGRSWAVLTVAVIMASASPARAQPASAAGIVIDGATGKPLAGATITADGVVVATSDRKGRFTTSPLEPGVTLIVLADGFEPALLTLADADGAEIFLLPLDLASEIIEVSGQAPPAAPGSTRLDRDEIETLPGAGGDVIAGLDALPGVTGGAPTGLSGVVIRGSAPEDSRILVDGFEIPLLYHMGLRSVIPTSSIAGLEYLPGGFDVAYGRASSGIVAVTTRGGGRALAGQFETSVIDAGVQGQGAVGDDGAVLVAVRRSVVDLVLPSLIPDDAGIQLTTVPRYWDGQVRYDQPLGTRWRGSVSVLGTSDIAEIIADDEADPDNRFYLEIAFARLIADARYHAGPWSATVAVSPIVQRTKFELGRSLYYRADKLGATARAEVTRSWTEAAGLTNVAVRGGAEVDVGRWTLDLATDGFGDEGEPESGPPTDPTMTFDDTVWVPDLAAWTAASASLDPRIRVTVGLRVDGFMRTRDVAVQPRGELAVQATRRTKVRLVAGSYRRPAENLDELLDRDLDPEASTQTVLGVERDVTSGVRVQASAYYTDRTSLITRADDGGFANHGRGTTLGGELLARFQRGAWSGFVSYALSRSTRVDRPGAEARLFDYDQPHDLNVALGYKRGGWQVGGRFQYGSGNPTTEVLGSVYDSDGDRYLPLHGPVNATRLPAHHQLDVRVDRSWHVAGMKLTAFLDVANVYLNAPLVGYEYSYDYSEKVAFEGLPIVPSIGLRGEL